jgi:leukotriene-A4 hydrolase
MSAKRVDSPPSGCPESKAGSSTYHFEQPVPIPSYLVALAVGALKSAKIGPRSHVWCEEPQLAACAYEFVDTEKFIQTGERLFGPYIWGTYDLLVRHETFFQIHNDCSQ